MRLAHLTAPVLLVHFNLLDEGNTISDHQPEFAHCNGLWIRAQRAASARQLSCRPAVKEPDGAPDSAGVERSQRLSCGPCRQLGRYRQST